MTYRYKRSGIIAFSTPILETGVRISESYLEEKGVSVENYHNCPPEVIQDFLNNHKRVFRGVGGSINNVLKGISMLGYQTSIYGICSDDKAGKMIMKSMENHNIENLIVVKPYKKTGQVVSCVHTNAKRTMLGSIDDDLFLESSDVNWNHVGNFEILAFDGYFIKNLEHDFVVSDIYKSMRERCQKIMFILDDVFWDKKFKDRAWDAAYRAFFICGTVDEFKKLYDIEDTYNLLKYLKTMEYDICGVTMGDEGAYVIQKETCIFVPPERKVNVVDTGTAGDYFAAGLFWAHLQGYDMTISGKVGSMFAAASISKLGNKPNPSIIWKIFEYLKDKSKDKNFDCLR